MKINEIIAEADFDDDQRWYERDFRNQMKNDAYADINEPAPQMNTVVPVEIFDPRNPKESVEVEVDTNVEYFDPDELTLGDIIIVEPFTFKGRQYKVGQPFPDELIPYVRGGDIKNYAQFEDYLKNLIEQFNRVSF